MAELKPCPFCGEVAVQIFSINPDVSGTYVYGCCTIACPGNALNQKRKCKTDKEAIEAWNRRAEYGK